VDQAGYEYTHHRHLLHLQIAVYTPPVNGSVLYCAMPTYQSPRFGS
jgi:hypothetical protein